MKWRGTCELCLISSTLQWDFQKYLTFPYSWNVVDFKNIRYKSLSFRAPFFIIWEAGPPTNYSLPTTHVVTSSILSFFVYALSSHMSIALPLLNPWGQGQGQGQDRRWLKPSFKFFFSFECCSSVFSSLLQHSLFLYDSSPISCIPVMI